MNLTGERWMALGFGAFGAALVWFGLDLPYWDGFAPGAGFLPVWIGAVLMALVALYLLRGEGAASGLEPGPAPDRMRPVAIALGLIACVALVEWLGFVLPVFAYLMFLLAGVERLSLRLSGAIAGGTAAAIFLVFDLVLRVPLPKGPWGF